jgi:hypothetical protein
MYIIWQEGDKIFGSKWEKVTGIDNFNCCLSVHVDNYTITVPTKCTSLLKAQDITICTFLSLYS